MGRTVDAFIVQQGPKHGFEMLRFLFQFGRSILLGLFLLEQDALFDFFGSGCHQLGGIANTEGKQLFHVGLGDGTGFALQKETTLFSLFVKPLAEIVVADFWVGSGLCFCGTAVLVVTPILAVAFVPMIAKGMHQDLVEMFFQGFLPLLLLKKSLLDLPQCFQVRVPRNIRKLKLNGLQQSYLDGIHTGLFAFSHQSIVVALGFHPLHQVLFRGRCRIVVLRIFLVTIGSGG